MPARGAGDTAELRKRQLGNQAPAHPPTQPIHSWLPHQCPIFSQPPFQPQTNSHWFPSPIHSNLPFLASSLSHQSPPSTKISSSPTHPCLL